MAADVELKVLAGHVDPPVVLAYHCIGEVARECDRHNLVVRPEAFRHQVERLLARGYEFVFLREFARRLRAGEALRKVCALTFDDGSVDNADRLPDLLRKLGVPATLFVCPGLLGRPHPFIAPEAGLRLMTSDELRETAALERVEIGSHTSEHVDLSAATEEDAYGEMSSSKRALEDLIGAPVSSFAYPHCRYSPDCPRAAERAGYTCAVTCGPRGGLRPFELCRQSIDPLDGRLSFALKSRAAFYPLWRSPAGRLARRISRPLRHPSDS